MEFVVFLLVVVVVYLVVKGHKGRNTGAGEGQTPTVPGEDGPKKGPGDERK